MMDHETPPRISLLDRLVKAIRPSLAPATSSPEMAEPAMHQPAMGEEPSGTMAGAPAMGDRVPMGSPSMAASPMAEPAMESTVMGDPAAVDEPSMG